MAEAAEQVTQWMPQPGPQTALLVCPVREIFYGGARGGGKTSGLIGHWLSHQARHGKDARGMLLRRTYPELDEVIRQCRAAFLLHGAVYKSAERKWQFPNGAEFVLRHLHSHEDADKYQGQQLTWLAFDELTNWADPEPLDRLRACLRSTAGVPTWYLATGNPGGPGHTWVKQRYIDPSAPLVPFAGDDGQQRIYIPSKVADNQLLLGNDPTYVDRLKASGPDWLVRAWLDGDWDIVAGAYLEGVWDRAQHVVRPFTVPPHWVRWRAMDWGTHSPYAVGWFTRSPEGVTYLYRELYGDGGKPNRGTRETADEVAAKIVDIELEEIRSGCTFAKNPADSSIWSATGSDMSVADHFRARGVHWIPARKGPGSRINGAHEIVARLKAGDFKVFDTCHHWLRTVPVIPRDDRVPEDVDTDAEDHCWDMTMYALTSRQRKTRREDVKVVRFTPVDASRMKMETKRQPRYTMRMN